MKIAEFLERKRQRLVTCRPNDTLDAVAKLMHRNGIGAVPVCEVGVHMVGIVSERDLVRAFATNGSGELGHLRVRDIMSTQVKSCGPDEDLHAAEQLMRRHHFRHVPVVEAERVVGMLSIRDTQAQRLQESEDEIHVLRDAVVAARFR